ncbi:hypothetical protein GCM10027321_33350 [Massilia terrae]|uniref:PEGA domain-containing protein n=1 Tax=Massilia terrae TaxID=1811224 RepID=A0ABT2CRV6_9BURK|nr:hypothetical protein [Massilia terrae]MCS0656703.1 hypothetical protein [Massilia terrae]
MMTSPSTNAVPALARPVRDVVSQQPDVVSEVWCRKIFRQVLQELERAHALQRGHAPISADTVFLDEHNDPALAPAAPGAPEPGEAADVQALGQLIHYAITQEEVPSMSLRKRGLPGYSDSLVTAVDQCAAADPAERPQTIADLRNLLGIVALGPALGTPAINPVYMQAANLPRPGKLASMGKGMRWTLIGLAAVVLMGAASAYWMMLRDTSSEENIVLTLPGAAPEPAPPSSKPEAVPTPQTSAGQPAIIAQSAAPKAASEAPPAPPQAAVAAPARERVAKPGTTSYKLFIKPWGRVYVNGSERGVSPPLKVLTLPPGNHTVRVVNPELGARIVKVHSINHGTGQIEVDFTE